MNQTQQGYPLAFLQKRIWSLQQEGHTLAVKGMLALEGPVEASRLREALQAVVDRHEILRTHYHTPQAFSYPWQVIAGRGTLAFDTRDTSGREPGEQAAALDACWQALLPADVSREESPVVSAVLVTLSPLRHRFLLCLPALAADAASLRVLFAEVLRAYWGAGPAEDPLQYCQFSEWVNDLGADPDPAARRDWQQYSLVPAPPNPFGWASETPHAPANGNPIRFRQPLPAPLAAALHGYAGALGAPLPVLLLAYWHVVIQRHAAAERNVTGLLLNHRAYDELQSLVGLVANTVPVASVITPQTTFPELVRQLGAEADRAAGWQECFSWDHLPGVHAPEGRLPRFSCGFEWVDATLDVAVPPGFACQYADFAGTPDLFDVRLCVLHGSTGLQLDLYGDPRAVSGAALAAIGDQLLTVLGHALTRQPERVAAMNLLSPVAADHIRRLSANPVALPSGRSLPEAFRARAARHPDHPAVRTATASLTYQALDERSDRLAAFLAGTRAVKPGDLVGVMTYRSEWAVVALLAVLKTGAAYVPLDPDYPAARTSLLLRESAPQALLAEDEALLARHGMAGPEAIPLREQWPAVAAYAGPCPTPPHAAADLAYVMYTSGSTGVPKGVEIRMGSLMNYLEWANAHYFGNEPGAPVGLFTSLSFDLSVTGLFGPLLRGDTVLLYGHGAINETLTEVFGENSPVRAVKMTPSHISLLRHLPLGKTPVRCVVVGGEALLPEHVRTLRQLNPGVAIYNEYGPTETTVGCTVKQIGGDAERVTIGTPAGNARIFVLAEAGTLQPVGVAGEICIGGAGVARGYRNRPEQTHEKFVPYPTPLGETGTMYRSGDLGRWLPNGELQYLGRNDNQIKIKGFRVEPEEIERAVLGFPGVTAATVTVRHDEDGAPYLAAYWVGGGTPDASLREHLERHLPGHLVPACLVRLDALPYTVNGKVDARALPDPRLVRAAADAYEAPRNPLEAQLAEVIGAVLHHDRPGIGESFYDLGIDSIKAIQIASRLHKAGLKVEVKEILRSPRIKELALLVRQDNDRAVRPLVTGPVALAPAQAAFFGTVRVAPHHYNQSVLLRADDLPEERVQAAFAALLQHHDALRTVFRREAGEPIRQACRPPGEPVSLAVWDLRGEADPAATLARRATALQASFTLETGPLVKPALIHLPEGERLLIVAHHLVMDGVSWRILLEDLAGLLQGLPLPPKTDAYLYWAERMAAHAGSPSVLAERPYWLALGQSLPDTSFAGSPGAECPPGGLQTVAFTLDPGQAQLLPRANAAFSTNTQDLLLAALGTALRETFGVSHPFVTVEGHGRETTLPDLNISRTVGWFTSEFPVLWPAETPADPLAELVACKEALRQVPAGGVHYRLLQALPAPAAPGDAIFRRKPPIRFNYLGSFRNEQGNAPFSFAEESVGQQRDPGQPVEYPLEISGLEDASGLTLSVTYHPALTDPARAGQLCRACEAALRQLIALCVAAPAGQVTPADLTLGGLPLPVVQSLAARYAVEDVLPLTATQEGMLFQKLLDETSPVYFQQLSYQSRAAWDPALVQRALDVLFERHGALRAAFVHDGWDQPLQVIRKRQSADFRYEDLRHLPDPAARAQYLRQYRSRDVARSFRLDADALLRVALFRTGEAAYEFVWSNHHIVLDGLEHEHPDDRICGPLRPPPAAPLLTAPHPRPLRAVLRLAAGTGPRGVAGVLAGLPAGLPGTSPAARVRTRPGEGPGNAAPRPGNDAPPASGGPAPLGYAQHAGEHAVGRAAGLVQRPPRRRVREPVGGPALGHPRHRNDGRPVDQHPPGAHPLRSRRLLRGVAAASAGRGPAE